jgi:glycosyltransferase involved in cell wall biosynthesis
MAIHVLVNATGSNSGGGQTYVLALAQELSRGGSRGLDWEILVQPALAEAVADFGFRSFRLVRRPKWSPVRRMIWEQSLLPLRARNARTVLLSLANYGPLIRRNRHVLLTRNALHFADGGLSGMNGARLRIESALARASVRAARVTVTATAAMGASVNAATGVQPVRIMFGPGLVEGSVRPADERFTFLHRTSWGPHKRLLDLLLAVRELHAAIATPFVVTSACDPYSSFAVGFHESKAERALLASDTVRAHVEFESFPPGRSRVMEGDAVVMPSTIESFCFPLAEGIAARLPIVAADSRFAREVTGGSALFVPPGDPVAFAAAMRRVLYGYRPPPPTSELLVEMSWKTHVDELAGLCRSAAQGRAGSGAPAAPSD